RGRPTEGGTRGAQGARGGGGHLRGPRVARPRLPRPQESQPSAGRATACRGPRRAQRRGAPHPWAGAREGEPRQGGARVSFGERRAKHPEDVTAALLYGHVAAERKEHKAAAQSLIAVYEKQPSPELALDIARELRAGGAPERAREYYTKVAANPVYGSIAAR